MVCGMISKPSGLPTVGKPPNTGPPLTSGFLDPYPWSAVSKKQSLDRSLYYEIKVVPKDLKGENEIVFSFDCGHNKKAI